MLVCTLRRGIQLSYAGPSAKCRASWLSQIVLVKGPAVCNLTQTRAFSCSRQPTTSPFSFPVLSAPPIKNLTYHRSLTTGASREETPPSIEVAKSMPTEFCQMTNDELLIFAARDDPSACRERLIREVMAVDNADWDTANDKVDDIMKDNKAFCLPKISDGIAGRIVSIPYVVGIVIPVASAIISFPLVFEINTAKWFNERYVTADEAEPKDLETWLEVGGWTWSWMEPVLGQISFLLLCFAFARNQMIHLGWKPYSDSMRNLRSRRLQRKYPQYNGMILHQVSCTDDWW